MKTFLISTLSGIFLNSVECHALGRLEDVYRIKDYIESTLVDVETTPETKSFEKIDNLLVNFNMKYRLELLLQETPQDKKLCSSERISKLNNDMYTLVEYFSVSNGEKTRYMVADTYPDQKRMFLRQGLSEILQDIKLLLFCYPAS